MPKMLLLKLVHILKVGLNPLRQPAMMQQLAKNLNAAVSHLQDH